MYVSDGDLRAVARLWRELAEFPAADADGALRHCLRELAQLIGANNVFWVGAIRDDDSPADDGLGGWRPRAIAHQYFDEERQRRVAGLLTELHADRFDPMSQANAARAGVTRAFLRPDLVEDAVWHRSWLYNEVLRPLRVEDRLMGTHVVGAQRESYIGLDRAPTDRRFGQRERDVLELFLSGCPLFHRELLRSRGLLDSGAVLSPRQRDVLSLLLTDKSEREIAAELGLKASTVHQYVVTILAKFKVKGRTGLLARWLRY